MKKKNDACPEALEIVTKLSERLCENLQLAGSRTCDQIEAKGSALCLPCRARRLYRDKIEGEKLLTPDDLDAHHDSGKSLEVWLGRKVQLHFGYTGTLVRHKTRHFAVRFRFGPCSKCGERSKTLYAVSSLHAGAWCYVYDAKGTYQANMRDDIYRCDCRKVDVSVKGKRK